ncbi:MAG TPA: hypothetical protein VHF89_09880 [Solirubrobacteraceae bacterium]|nr:hypothetical protein [Solirubrobacteraceae bacterium]
MTFTRLLTFLGLAAAAVIAAGILLGENEVRHFPVAATPRAPVAAGGLVYRAMDARTLDPHNPVDRRILRGVPAVQRPLRRGEAWFGVFLMVTNPGHAPLRSTGRLSLVDAGGRRFAAQRLPRDGGYAYRAGVIAAGGRYPRNDSAPARNLAAQGALVLFRVPRRAVQDGSLALTIGSGATSIAVS